MKLKPLPKPVNRTAVSDVASIPRSVVGTFGSSGPMHGVVATPVPYRMRIDVVLEDLVVEQRIVARVHGDLEGPATLRFEGDGAVSRAHVAWALEMMQRPMRVAARVAHPLLRWWHDRVVDVTVDGLRRQLVVEGGR